MHTIFTGRESLYGLPELKHLVGNAVPCEVSKLPSKVSGDDVSRVSLPRPDAFTPPPRHAQLKQILSEGADDGALFAPTVAQAFANIFNMTVTPTGLRDFYARLLPSAHWMVYIGRVSADKCHLEYEVVATNHDGRVIATFARDAVLHREAGERRPKGRGPLELHSSNLFVHPDYRGLAITARCESLEAAWLLSASTHRQTRLTLAAGSCPDPGSGGHTEHLGRYVHALRGYLFADQHGAHKLPAEYEPRINPQDGSQISDYEANDVDNAKNVGRDAALMRQEGAVWLRKHAPKICRVGQQTPMDDEACASLLAQLQACREPWQFALWGKGFVLGGMPLGKAWLTSPSETYWRGVRFVHMDTTPEENFSRRASAGIFSRRREVELQRARGKMLDQWRSVQKGINGDPTARQKAYVDIGKYGDPAWGNLLALRTGITAMHEIDLLHDTLDKLEGTYVSAGLQETIANTTLPGDVRRAHAAYQRAWDNYCGMEEYMRRRGPFFFGIKSVMGKGLPASPA